MRGSSEAKKQEAMAQISQSCEIKDLTISTKRTRLYTKQHLQSLTEEATITTKGQNPKVVDNEPILEGDILSHKNKCSVMLPLFTVCTA